MPPGTFTSSLLASPSFTRSARLLENSGEKATTKFISLTHFPMFCGRGGEFRAEGVVTLHPPHRVGKDELKFWLRCQDIPFDEVYGTGIEDMLHRVPCVDKVRDTIGWVPERSLDEILRDVIAGRTALPSSEAIAA